MDTEKHIWTGIRDRVRENFRHATLNFIFIILFVNVFQWIFGMENSIVGVIFTIMMSASMVRDLTANPVRHFCIQAFVLMLMTAAACFVANANPWLALLVNFGMIFVILYAFTYEYVSHLYFPYILSYLFLIFISPVKLEQLPKRLLGVFTGAVCIILYQLFMGRKRIVNTARDVLVSMIDHADTYIFGLLSGGEIPQEPETLRKDLCKISRIVHDRRKKALCISDASFAMIDAGRGLENLVLLLYELVPSGAPGQAALLQQISECLSDFRAFLQKEADSLQPVMQTSAAENSAQFYDCLEYIRGHMLKMIRPEERTKYRKTLLSFSVRIKAALNISSVRVIYALRVAILLALCTLLVQLLALPHGKWLLFTVASVSLPYADDVGRKAKKRFLATLLGSLVSIAAYALIPYQMGRTAVMMLSGYLTFYFQDYVATFACSTVGAIGGAVFMGTFGWGAVGGMLLVRLGYIAAGIIIGFLANCLIFPYKRKTATRQLWRKYTYAAELLTKICRSEQIDPQLYYSLVIQSHLLENKLSQNAADLNWQGANEILQKCRQAVREAHRSRALTN